MPLANSADYSQVAGTFSITLFDIFLPMQTVYQGQTDRCNPKSKFPEGFNITQSVNHCCNEEKSIELID